jgi:hypothetical protein
VTTQEDCIVQGNHNPTNPRDYILVYGELAYIDTQLVPRRVRWALDHTFVMYGDDPVEFDKLIPTGEEKTDGYGWMRNYAVARPA